MQHGDRGRRARRPGRRSTSSTIDYLQGPAVRAQGRALGRSGRLLAHAAQRRRRTLRPRARRSTRRTLRPMVTWGTSPEMVVPVDGRVPDPAHEADPVRRAGMQRALELHGPRAGHADRVDPPRQGLHRLVHQRAHRGPARRRRGGARAGASPPTIRQALVVPGSGLVKAQAEAEGLDRIFTAAGFEWREPGCSMCLGMNDDRLGPGERCASTSNRNFEGRQGAGRAQPPGQPGDGRGRRDRRPLRRHHRGAPSDAAIHHARRARRCRSTAPTSTPTRSSPSSS